MRGAFSGFHPAVNFLYFVIVLGFTMYFMNPICLVISVICAAACSALGAERSMGRLTLRFLLPVFAVAFILNPLFNHRGATILLYFKNGNPLTLESLLYGAAAGFMMCAAVLWFKCFSHIMTSDKFVYLFGRAVPNLALLFSMTLRFIPLYLKRLKTLGEVRRTTDFKENKNPVRRLKSALSLLSALATWALENAALTADSMKCRGYSLPGRTSFSIYKFTKRDALMTVLLAAGAAYVAVGTVAGHVWWLYYPTLRWAKPDAAGVSVYAVYAVLCAAPVIIEISEGVKWKKLKSKI